MNILVVEDDSTQRFLISKLIGLCKGVASIIEVRDADDALRALDSCQIDGAIIDLVLKRASGLDVAEACVKKGVPIVFHTAVADDHNLAMMYDFGWVIPKPARLPMISRAIDYFRLSI